MKKKTCRGAKKKEDKAGKACRGAQKKEDKVGRHVAESKRRKIMKKKAWQEAQKEDKAGKGCWGKDGEAGICWQL